MKAILYISFLIAFSAGFAQEHRSLNTVFVQLEASSERIPVDSLFLLTSESRVVLKVIESGLFKLPKDLDSLSVTWIELHAKDRKLKFKPMRLDLRNDAIYLRLQDSIEYDCIEYQYPQVCRLELYNKDYSWRDFDHETSNKLTVAYLRDDCVVRLKGFLHIDCEFVQLQETRRQQLINSLPARYNKKDISKE